MTENDDMKGMIKDLRIATEKVVERLKVLEIVGIEGDANAALWKISELWNGKEYRAIETTLRTKGHKSALDVIVEKNKEDDKKE